MGHAETAAFRTIDEALVPQMLEEYGELVRKRLHDYLQNRAPRYYLDDLVADYPKRGGKLLRPCLCIAAARIFGAEAEDAVASAVSIELLHNALLIHDDIEDDSDQRRGAPTLHSMHGVPLALNAGDALGLLSLVPLKDNVSRLGLGVATQIFEETERTAWASAEGQALELGWQRDGKLDLGEEDYLTMVLLKTCWLTTIHPLRVGCLIGSAGKEPLDPLIRLGFFFGAAFQIQDDVLNLEGGDRYGKETAGDLFEGKRTLMVIHALRTAKAAPRRRLARFLSLARSQRRPADVCWVRELLDETGALAYARDVAAGLAGAGLYEFDRYFAGHPQSRDLRFVRGLLTWVMRRSH